MVSPEIIIVKTELRHIRELADNLRIDDMREIEACGVPVYKAIRRSVVNSVSCSTVLVDDSVAAIFGVCGVLLSDAGTPWLLTTPASEMVSSLTFARIYQKEVLKMLKTFPYLENYVHSSYSKAIKLLQNIGFEVAEEVEIGENRALFRKFTMRAA